jgi:eukaryotic-like serine/threonine-protein kinase
MRFRIQPPPGFNYSQFDRPAVSPDGRHLVCLGSLRGGKIMLWLRSLNSLDMRPLPGTEDATAPFWSPDSRYIAFTANRKLKRTDLFGTAPLALADVGISAGGSWSSNGTILLGLFADPMIQVPATGGVPKPALELDRATNEVAQTWPAFLPDGQHFLYLSRNLDVSRTEIRVSTIGSKGSRAVMATRSAFNFVAPHWLLSLNQDTIMAQALDPDGTNLTGERIPLAEGVTASTIIGGGTFFAQPGVLVLRGANSINAVIAVYSREGKRLSARAQEINISQMVLSPDEKRLSLEAYDPKSLNRDIWLLELASGITSRITTDPGRDGDPVWSPDGRQLMLSSTRNRSTDLYRKTLGGPPEEVFFASKDLKYPSQWLRDDSILYIIQDGKAFYRIPLTGERKPTVLFESEFDKDQPNVSYDGRWVAYNSLESGRWEVYVASFPGFQERRQISTSGGCQPLWRKDGKEIFYLNLEGKLLSVEMKPAGTQLEPGVPTELFSVPVRVEPIRNQYAVTGDGRKFYVLENVDQNAPAMTVILNWESRLPR